MAAPPKLVNKQFNSPIGLYSQQNIQEVMQREEQILANGAVGIDFYNPQVGKPANLQNSAVLRMLEEEERRRQGGRAGNEHDYTPRPLRDVNWPPQDYVQGNQRATFKDVVIPGAKKVTWPPNYDDSDFVQQPAAQPQGGQQYSQAGFQPQAQPHNNYSQQQTSPHQQPQGAQYRPLKPLDVSSVTSGSPLTSPALNQSPLGFRPSTPSQKGWAPVHSPVLTPNQPQWRTQAPPQASQGQSSTQFRSVAPPQSPGGSSFAPYSPTVQSSVAAPNYQSQSPQAYGPQSPSVAAPYAQSPSAGQVNTAPNYFAQTPAQQSSVLGAQGQAAAYRPPARQVEPPPSTITLRQEAPVSQAPPPVYKSQPTTATLKVTVGGKHLRGDLKWPPEEVKERMQEERKQQLDLAKGPACRPRKQEKDYTGFFAQHALNSTYPGYKIPPGTQFYRPEYDS